MTIPINFSSRFWLIVFLTAIAPSLATAEPVSVIISAAGGGGDCVVGEACRIFNPDFRPVVNEENPLAVDQMEWVESAAADAAPPPPSGGSATDLTIVVDFSPDLSNVVLPGAGAAVFAISMRFNDPASTPITQFTGDSDLTFNYPNLVGGVGNIAELQWLDESGVQAVWRPQSDLALCGSNGKGSMVCGKTDHFTLFAVVSVPEPSSALLFSVGFTTLAMLRSRTHFA